jgi:hypothetical protein
MTYMHFSKRQSNYVTCKYKGISFLQFLLSREKDIDVFRQSGGRRRTQPTIEVIPDEYRYARRSRRRDWDQIPQQPYTDIKVELNTAEVRRILAEKNMSLKRLAQKIGVNSGHLSLVMTGRQHPPPKMWEKILSVL